LKINGWEIFFLKIFYLQYSQLVKDVNKISQKHPNTYKSHPKTKLLASIQNSIKNDVPADPLHKKFMLSKSLENKYKEWRRVKQGLPPRYRMFFRFYSATKEIIFAWINSEGCIRKSGDKYDVYAIFKKMLDRGEIPKDYEQLIAQSKVLKKI
jgi:toxin YhaV